MKTKTKLSHIGLDGHREFSLATGRDEEQRVVWRRRLDHGDRRKLREELRTWPPGTPVVLEATFGWGWLCDELQEAGLNPRLADCRKVAAWREARGLAKTDRLDADLLSELWSERTRWWEVWLAPPEVRQQRERLRHRMAMVRMQTVLKNQIHAVLHRHGIVQPFSDLFGTQGRAWLKALVEPDDATLPQSGRATVAGCLRLLDPVRREIAKVTWEFRRAQAKSAASERLRSLPGIAWVLAYTILAEIGSFARFASAGHLASYSLLAPRSRDSGRRAEENQEAPQGRHVGKVGRRTLKWAWLEAAHGAVKGGGRFRQIFDRRTNHGKRDKNRGYITVAHELCRLAYAMEKNQTTYCETPPPRPGTKTESNSHPEVGQPDGAMIAAVG